jgi:hypothetical protein
MLRAAALVAFVAFTTFNAYVVSKCGVACFFPPFEQIWQTQIFLDLAIALTLVNVWMVLDTRKRGRPFYRVLPYLAGTVIFGSPSPLLYLVLRTPPVIKS